MEKIFAHLAEIAKVLTAIFPQVEAHKFNMSVDILVVFIVVAVLVTDYKNPDYELMKVLMPLFAILFIVWCVRTHYVKHGKINKS